MTALLLGSSCPDLASGQAVRARLGAARVKMAARLPALLSLTRGMAPIDALRVMLASVSGSQDGPLCLDAAAILAVGLAALHRREAGRDPVEPDPHAGHVADLQRMIAGAPDPDLAHALETYLVTVADHGMNASTFAARVIASTQSDLISAVTGALGALKGPLHGGAPGPVLDMLDGIGGMDGIEGWIAGHLGNGERLMGFGHRIYRTRDPRADVLKAALTALADRNDNRVAFAERVEAEARAALAKRHPDRRLDTNVEFYTALLLEAVGIDRAFFTPLFGAGRVLGWLAHAMEQRDSGRLIRPLSRYIGPLPEGAPELRVAAG